MRESEGETQGRGRRATGVETDRVVHLDVTYREASAAAASDVLVSRRRWPSPGPPGRPLEIVETCKPKVPHAARKFPRGKFRLSSLWRALQAPANRNYKYLPAASLFLAPFRSLPTLVASFVAPRTDIIQILPSYRIIESAGRVPPVDQRQIAAT